MGETMATRWGQDDGDVRRLVEEHDEVPDTERAPAMCPACGGDGYYTMFFGPCVCSGCGGTGATS